MSRESRTNQLGYFTMSVPDMARARAFYASVFEWGYDAAPDMDRYSHIEKSEPPGGLTAASPPAFTIYFRVDDIAAAVQRVRTCGGHASAPTKSDSGWHASATDDQGLSFSLWQPAPGL